MQSTYDKPFDISIDVNANRYVDIVNYVIDEHGSNNDIRILGAREMKIIWLNAIMDIIMLTDKRAMRGRRGRHMKGIESITKHIP